MTRIKFCGMRRDEDIRLANTHRPDYVGLIFAPSKRQVTPAQASNLVRLLDPDISPVGVFVDEDPDRIASIVKSVGLKAVQLHGSEGPAEWLRLRRLLAPEIAIWQKVSIPADPQEAADRVKAIERMIDQLKPTDERPDVWLLDTEVGGQTGGTGRTFPWELLRDIADLHTVALAGGLTPDNVAAAINSLHPAIVDCSSGIERNLEKQSDLMNDFCRAVRQTERT